MILKMYFSFNNKQLSYSQKTVKLSKIFTQYSKSIFRFQSKLYLFENTMDDNNNDWLELIDFNLDDLNPQNLMGV
jgi:hypothetical protein